MLQLLWDRTEAENRIYPMRSGGCLAETSAKGVRGSKMEDVIFSGSNSRRAMSSAEVSLILDNSSESGKIPDCGDEIVVTRRCIRGGESEYLIDRKPPFKGYYRVVYEYRSGKIRIFNYRSG